MYLLLLASAIRIGQEKRIGWGVLTRGLGESLTAEKIERIAEALSRHRLAMVRVTDPSEAGGRQRGHAAPAVYATVFGLTQLGGPRLRSLQRGRAHGDG